MKAKKQKPAPTVEAPRPSILDIANRKKASTQEEKDVARMMASPALGRLMADPAARQRFNGVALASKVDPLMTGVMLEAGASVDWEARCKAAEALLAASLERCSVMVPFPPPTRGMSQCENFATGVRCVGDGKHACDFHLALDGIEWEDHAPLVRAWLALREPK